VHVHVKNKRRNSIERGEGSSAASHLRIANEEHWRVSVEAHVRALGLFDDLLLAQLLVLVGVQVVDVNLCVRSRQRGVLSDEAVSQC
jgi:hypothetical protein